MTDHSSHGAHRVRKPETDSTIGDSATTIFWKYRDDGNTACADPVLRVLSFDGSLQSMAVLLLAVEREISAFDLVFHLHARQERHGIAAEPARALHVAVSEGVPVLGVTTSQRPAEAVALKIQEILGCSPGAPVSDGAIAEVAIAAGLDDLHLATASDVPFIRHRFPCWTWGGVVVNVRRTCGPSGTSAALRPGGCGAGGRYEAPVLDGRAHRAPPR